MWQSHPVKQPPQLKGSESPSPLPSLSLLGISHRVQWTLKSSGPRLHLSYLQPSHASCQHQLPEM